MANVLVLKLGALGDLLLADGALRDLRAHHPHDRLVLLTRRPFAALMARCPWVDEVLVDDNVPRWNLPQLARLARRLRAYGFTCAYDLQQSRRTAFYRRWLLPAIPWLGSRKRRGATQGPSGDTPSLIEHVAGQLAAGGVAASNTLHPCPDWLAQPLPGELFQRLVEPYIVLLPGSSARHGYKRWPHYGALASALQAEGHRIVSVPGPDEMEDRHRLPGEVLLDEGRPLGLGMLATVLQGADFVVGNDSGPTHLAAHLGCRGVALYGDRGPSPRQTGILRPGFTACEGSPLAALPASTVMAAIRAGLTRAGQASDPPALQTNGECAAGRSG